MVPCPARLSTTSTGVAVRRRTRRTVRNAWIRQQSVHGGHAASYPARRSGFSAGSAVEPASGAVGAVRGCGLNLEIARREELWQAAPPEHRDVEASAPGSAPDSLACLRVKEELERDQPAGRDADDPERCQSRDRGGYRDEAAEHGGYDEA